MSERALKIYNKNDNVEPAENPENIRKLTLIQCQRVTVYPYINLCNLELICTDVQGIPSNLPNLQRLYILKCEKMEVLTLGPNKLTVLSINDCVKLKEISGCLTHVNQLSVKNCKNLRQLPSTGPDVQQLYVIATPIEEIPDTYTNLRSLELIHVNLKTSIPAFSKLRCLILVGVQAPAYPLKLLNLRILDTLDSIEDLSDVDYPLLRKLVIRTMDKQVKLPRFAPALRELRKYGVYMFYDIPKVPELYTIPYYYLRYQITMNYIDCVISLAKKSSLSFNVSETIYGATCIHFGVYGRIYIRDYHNGDFLITVYNYKNDRFDSECVPIGALLSCAVETFLLC